MKILNLQIIDDGINIRNIDFFENGASFIYGDVEKKNEHEETSNSIGKSTLIDMIDFCFGSNTKFKKGLDGVTLIARVRHENITYTIERTIIDSKKLIVFKSDNTVVNDVKNDKDLREYFSIDRDAINLQLIKLRKKDIISQHNPRPNVSELVSFLSLLSLDSLAKITEKICDIQDKISCEESIAKKIFIQETGIEKFKPEKIDNHIFSFKDKLKSKQKEEQDLSIKMKNLKISEEYSDVSSTHSNKLTELRQLSSELSLLKRELERIEGVLQESKDSILTADKIVDMFERSKQELPNQITRTLYEVEEFHKNVIEDRESILISQKENISLQVTEKVSSLNALKEESDRLGEILSQSNAYQKALELYKKVTIELQGLRFNEGKLSALEKGSEKIKDYNESLTRCFADLQQNVKNYENVIGEYRDFVNSMIKKLYGTNKRGYLDIRNRERHKKNKPILVELDMEHDSKGGIGQVKNNIIDYLIFNYNTQLEFLIQDSSCFAEVDPKQICTMLEEAHKIAEAKNKQYIVAINKYELGEYYDYVKFAKDRQVITLSESIEQKLMKRNFD